MHPRSWILLSALLVALAAHAAVIYKWKDADGIWHYSDQPVEGAEKIVTAGTSTYSGAASVRGLAKNAASAGSKTAPGPAMQMAISSPTPEQTFFGDESIPVSLALNPAPSPGMVIVWTLNGAPLSNQPPTATSFTLQSLARGTYSLSATLSDADTGTSQSANVTFYVRQPSELSPQHRGR